MSRGIESFDHGKNDVSKKIASLPSRTYRTSNDSLSRQPSRGRDAAEVDSDLWSTLMGGKPSNLQYDATASTKNVGEVTQPSFRTQGQVEKPATTVEETTQIEKTVDAMLRRKQDPAKLLGAVKYGLANYAANLTTGISPFSPEVVDIEQKVTEAIFRGDSQTSADENEARVGSPNGIKANYSSGNLRVPDQFLNTRITLVGGGPAAAVTGGILHGLGFNKLTYIYPETQPGGIWQPKPPKDSEKWGEQKVNGYINPGAVVVNDAQLTLTQKRETSDFQRFIRDVAPPQILYHHRAKVIGVENINGVQRVHFNRDQVTKQIMSDFVIVTTGNHPLDINNGSQMSFSGLEDVSIKRWPSLTPYDDYMAMAKQGQRVLCIGWGNGTLAKVGEMYSNHQKYGPNVDTVVLSHIPGKILDDPHSPIKNSDGTISPPLARNPSEGRLTSLALDIPGNLETYNRSLKTKINNNGQLEAGTVGGVIHCDFYKSGQGINASVTSIAPNGELIVDTIPNIGAIYGLVGYGNDASLMRDMGLTVTDPYRGTVAKRKFDGKAITEDERDIFVIGAAGVNKQSPNAGVLPGIVHDATQSVYTIIHELYMKFLK